MARLVNGIMTLKVIISIHLLMILCLFWQNGYDFYIHSQGDLSQLTLAKKLERTFG